MDYDLTPIPRAIAGTLGSFFVEHVAAYDYWCLAFVPDNNKALRIPLAMARTLKPLETLAEACVDPDKELYPRLWRFRRKHGAVLTVDDNLFHLVADKKQTTFSRDTVVEIENSESE